jgi:hypothetical protein
MTNFKQETLEELEYLGKTIEDIDWIGCGSFQVSNFWEWSDLEYDSGYGGQEMPTNIIIVFKDGSNMYRHEYDGSEEWRYNSVLVKPEEIRELEPFAKPKYDSGLGDFCKK